jgi:hypothetical protein
MPEYSSYETIVGPYKGENLKRDTLAPDFDPMPVYKGSKVLYKDKLKDIPPGILVCKNDFALGLTQSDSVVFLKKAIKLIDSSRSVYYTKAVLAESLYQEDILKLSKKSERSWLEKNAFYIGLAAGASAVIALILTAAQL